MKTVLLTTALLLFVLLGNAQSDTTIRTVTVTVEKNEDNDHHKPKNSFEKLRFGMIDLGVSTYFPESGGLNDLPEEIDFMEQRIIKSTNVNINLVRHRFLFAKDHLLLEYGLTIMSNKYFFEESFRMEAGADNFFDAVNITGENFRKNRLMANYLTIPINFGFSSNPDDLGNSFSLAAGAYGGFLMNANHKIKGGDISGKEKTKDNFNLNTFIWGLEARMGYGPFNLYAQYNMTEMFREDRGPVLNQFNIGISILPY